MNKFLNKFDISLLPNNETFKYYINNKFFNCFTKDNQDYRNPKIKIYLKKINNNENIILNFYFLGCITLICDISLNKFLFRIKKKKTLNIFFDKNLREDSEDNIILPINTLKLNISQYIYDTIYLMIPFKKIDPKIKKKYNYL